MAYMIRPLPERCDDCSYPANLDKVCFIRKTYAAFDCEFKWRLEFCFSEKLKINWAYKLKADRDEDFNTLSNYLFRSH